MKASDLFVKALENEGVRYIFALPGEENLDLLESIRSSSIQLIVTRHEQAAGFMAATYGRLTGLPGVCLSTLGPGATNLVTPAAFAQLGAMPLLMITGQKPIKTSKQGQFQILDVVNMMRPITKYTKSIVNGKKISSTIRQAFNEATTERPGAVHIELPEDIAIEEVPDRIYDVVGMEKPLADPKSIERAARMIERAKRPLLLIGAGANRSRASKALEEFVDRFEFPFFNTQMGKGIVDERHRLFLGTAALSEHDFLHAAIREADLIINVGHDVVEKPPFFMEEGTKKVIHVNFFPAEVDEVYFPDLNVVGDLAHSIREIGRAIQTTDRWDFSLFEKVKQQVEHHLSKYFQDNRFPILPQRLVKVTRDLMPENGIVALDNGMYKIWFARNFKAYRGNTVLLDNALASMGAGFPSAMAAKLIYPDRKVVAVCGDGGFLMNGQEMETAVRLNLDLVLIILRDEAYGMIRWKQQEMEYEDFGLDFDNPDFVTFAESYGATGHRPDSVESFRSVFEQALDAKGVHLIDLPVDYSLNHEIFNVLLKEKSRKL